MAHVGPTTNLVQDVRDDQILENFQISLIFSVLIILDFETLLKIFNCIRNPLG